MSATPPSAQPSDLLSMGILSPSPAQPQPQPQPLTHCDADYTRQRLARRQRLIWRMQPDNATRTKLDRDPEFMDFLDLIARLLDPNPATRFTSEDATQHRFCIGVDYVRHDEKLHELLRHKFDSAFPRVTISTDADRQRRLDAQLQRYQQHCAAKANGDVVPKPSGKAIARRTSHSDVQCSDASVCHSRAVCLVRGCCGSPTIAQPQPMFPSATNNLRLTSESPASPMPTLSEQTEAPSKKHIKPVVAVLAPKQEEERKEVEISEYKHFEVQRFE